MFLCPATILRSQQEPKVMTQMCGDPKMIKAYQEGKDLYAEIAALSFNTTYDNCLEFRPDGTTNPEGKAFNDKFIIKQIKIRFEIIFLFKSYLYNKSAKC